MRSFGAPPQVTRKSLGGSNLGTDYSQLVNKFTSSIGLDITGGEWYEKLIGGAITLAPAVIDLRSQYLEYKEGKEEDKATSAPTQYLPPTYQPSAPTQYQTSEGTQQPSPDKKDNTMLIVGAAALIAVLFLMKR
jgi:hypothetical protein